MSGLGGAVFCSTPADDRPRAMLSADSRGYGGAMPCFVIVFAFFSPRLALVAMALLSDVLSRSMGGILLPIIGFFVLPWTTLAYAFMWNYGTNAVTGFEWFIVGFAFLVDLGVIGGASRGRD